MLTNDNLVTVPQTFTCTIINSKLIIPNFYRIQLNILPMPPVNENIGIGYQRIKYFFNNCLQDSILINKDHESLEHYIKYENNVVTLPCDPYDFYFGTIIFAKLSAILENYFEIRQLVIDSAIGDNVNYYISDAENTGLILEGDYWWNQNNTSTGPKSSPSWNELNLAKSSKFQPKIIHGGLSETR